MLEQQAAWNGPYMLTSENVDSLIMNDGPGLYVLGSPGGDKKFELKFVGSCANVKARLKSYLGKYQLFMVDTLEFAAQRPTYNRPALAVTPEPTFAIF